MSAPKKSAAKVAKDAKADESLTGGSPTAAPTPPEPKASKSDDSHLVSVTKGGETLRVHPSCVAAHQRAGWVTA